MVSVPIQLWSSENGDRPYLFVMLFQIGLVCQLVRSSVSSFGIHGMVASAAIGQTVPVGLPWVGLLVV